MATIPEHPALTPIFDRGERLYREGIERNGRPPERCVVSQEEYRTLLIYRDEYGPMSHSSDWQELRLFGMRVCLPKRYAWRGSTRVMSHYQYVSEPLCVLDAIPEMGGTLTVCDTALPDTPQAEIVCSCGEVIWDLRTAVYVGYDPAREMRQPMALKPLIDSEKSTFAEWVAGVDALVAEVKVHD